MIAQLKCNGTRWFVGAILLACVAGVMPAAAQTCTPPPSGMVAWWPGDGNANDIKNVNHGALGGPVDFAPGVVGGAFLMPPGTDAHVSVPDHPSLNPTAISIDAWVFVSNSDLEQTIVAKVGTLDRDLTGYSLILFRNTFFFSVYVQGFGFHTVELGAAVQEGEWHHIAFTFDGMTASAYLNGEPTNRVRFFSSPQPIHSSGKELNIGRHPATGGNFFAGMIDELEIFGRAISEDEVIAIVKAGPAGKCKPVDAIRVEIDIKPGSFPNSINLSAAGTVPVAIFGSEAFDATQIDPETVSLAGASVKMVGKSGKYLCSAEDVNGDGRLDLVCHVQTAQFMIEPGDSVAVLEAKTFDGRIVRGEDSIRIVPD